MSNNNIDLKELYKETLQEQRYFSEDHNKRIVGFTGLISAITFATLAGFLKVSQPLHYLALLLGPVAMFTVSQVALEAIKGLHRRWLECISMRAKIEYRLGLMNPSSGPTEKPLDYLRCEPLVPPRHIEDFEKHQSSQNWLDMAEGQGYQKHVTFLFKGVRGMSIALFLLILNVFVVELRKVL